MREGLSEAPNISPAKPDKNRHKMELMRESHEQAIAAYNLEKIILERPDIGATDIFDDPEVKAKRVKVKNTKVFSGFSSVLKSYIERREWTKEQFSMLCKMYGESQPEVLGRRVFKQFTGREPVGKVTFEQREAYFIMVCENYDDFAYVSNPVGVPGEEEGPPDFPRISSIGAQYHKRFFLDLGEGEERLPVILTREDSQKRTMLHERQHFINHELFNLFRETERHPAVQIGTIYILLRIKDELLAFIRDGRSGQEVEDALSNNLYDHLFDGLSPEDKEKYKTIIGLVGDLLTINQSELSSPEARAILTYQLASIPLSRFPAWLEELDKFYFARARGRRQPKAA